MNEQQLIEMIAKQQDWEELVYNIVTMEGLDPMDIDLVRLADAFMEFVNKMEEFDFRIPAKVVLVAAILLKMKMDYLFGFGQQQESLRQETIDEEMLEKIDFEALKDFLGKFKVPVKKQPVRKVTLDELVEALRKALAVEERRKRRRIIARKRVEEVVNVDQEDIEQKLERMLAEIESLLNKFKKKTIPFKSIVGEWKRDKIIDRFIPVLYLDFRRKIDARQEKMFDEIYITKIENGHEIKSSSKEEQ